MRNNNSIKDLGKELIDMGVNISLITFPHLGVPITVTWSAVKALMVATKARNEQRFKEMQDNIGFERVIELLESSDELKDETINILNKIWEESSLKRRELYYKYLFKLGKDSVMVNRSRLLYVMSVIDFWQIDLLGVFQSIIVKL